MPSEARARSQPGFLGALGEAQTYIAAMHDASLPRLVPVHPYRVHPHQHSRRRGLPQQRLQLRIPYVRAGINRHQREQSRRKFGLIRWRAHNPGHHAFPRPVAPMEIVIGSTIGPPPANRSSHGRCGCVTPALIRRKFAIPNRPEESACTSSGSKSRESKSKRVAFGHRKVLEKRATS